MINTQQNRYNGKEWIEAHGYDSNDYQARTYNPAIMRFDPLAEKKTCLTPYYYCSNYPIESFGVANDITQGTVMSYNALNNDIKRKYTYKLPKRLGVKTGDIIENQIRKE